jgi:RecD/TraA family predicted helicase
VEEHKQLTGEIESVFSLQDVLKIKTDQGEVLAEGDFQDVYPGDTLTIYGKFEQHYQWGRIFKVAFYRDHLNQYWVAKWLKLNEGLEDKEIIRILVEQEIPKHISLRLQKVKKARKIYDYLIQKKCPEEAIASIEKWNRWSQDKIIDNPYLLLESPDVHFNQILEIIDLFDCEDPPSPKASYLAENLLKKGKRSGHYCLPVKDIHNELQKHGLCQSEVTWMENLVIQNELMSLKKDYQEELTIAKIIRHRLKQEDVQNDMQMFIEPWEKENQMKLAKNQKRAVQMAIQKPFCIISGGPGVGKTTVCKCVTDILGVNNQITLVAPTGRAAQRARKSTGIEAHTLHKLLGFNGSVFTRQQVTGDVFIIDESSMVDSKLFLIFLKALPASCKVILVGDVNQLPSVGPGKVLKDLIDSEVVPVTMLTDVFRQSADSQIVSLAYDVNDGKFPKEYEHEDLIMKGFHSEKELKQNIIDLSIELYKSYNLYDVQIIAPIRRGMTGITELNKLIQANINPQGKENVVEVERYQLRKNDKVMQNRNDHKQGINNGDVGTITYCTSELIKVSFQGKEHEVLYKPHDFKNLELAYAITVHKSQGSEYKFVVLPVVSSYGHMLQKNLLYTGITRAKKRLWLYYEQEALIRAVNPNSVVYRYTSLAKHLIAE